MSNLKVGNCRSDCGNEIRFDEVPANEISGNGGKPDLSPQEQEGGKLYDRDLV
ncbi:hypothetical protein SDC9_81980 [bioreactor metagenome]|uniref:Uncharacterized protein n=1 Tax=bioreactor metagenome TaxID=1076179 RepID=A0A644Z495_9ZZZZ